MEWVEKEIWGFPADPEERKHGLDLETWAKMRRTEARTRALWQVKPACGHHYNSVITDEDLKPEDGPRLVSRQRRDEMLSDLEEYWATREGETGRPKEGSHIRRMLNVRWLRPELEHECRACSRAKRVLVYSGSAGLCLGRSRPR